MVYIFHIKMLLLYNLLIHHLYNRQLDKSPKKLMEVYNKKFNESVMLISSKLCIRNHVLHWWILLNVIILKSCWITLIKGKGKANCEISTLYACFNAPWKCIYLSLADRVNTIWEITLFSLSSVFSVKACGCGNISKDHANDPPNFRLSLFLPAVLSPPFFTYTLVHIRFPSHKQAHKLDWW